MSGHDLLFKGPSPTGSRLSRGLDHFHGDERDVERACRSFADDSRMICIVITSAILLLPFPPPLPPAFVLSMMCAGLSISAFEQFVHETLGVSAFPSHLLPSGGGADDPTVLLQPNAKLAVLPTHFRFIPEPSVYLKVHTASYHFLGNGKIRRFGCSLLFSGVARVTHHGLHEAL